MKPLFVSSEATAAHGGAGQTPGERGRRRVKLSRGETGWTGRVNVALDAAAAWELRGLLPEAALDGQLLLDCRRAAYATAAGLRALLEISASLRARGGSLLLLSSPGALREILRLSGIDRLPGVSFPENEPESLDSIQ